MSAPTSHETPTGGRSRRVVVLLVCAVVVLGVAGAGTLTLVRAGLIADRPGVQGSADEYPPVPTPSVVPGASVAPGAATTPGAATGTATSPDRRGFLYAIGRSLTAQEVDAVPRSYGVVVMNQWDSAAARRIKQLDPSVVVLMYQCLSSMRTTDDATHRSGGVFPSQVAANPQWYAKDTAGKRIPWGPWYGHWQMAVWDTGYQRAWVTNAVSDVVAGGWDGVLADNDLSTLSWYSDQVLAGTSSHQATDHTLRSAVTTLIDRAGPALNARGKLLVVNISDARLFPGKWAAHTRFGGGLEENFAHFGTSTSDGWLDSADDQGWTPQTDEMRSPGLSLAITRAAPGDHRTLLYGYASMLVRADADAYWMPSVEADGGYRTQPTIPEMSLPLGVATGPPAQTRDGAWTRQYEHQWVAVNPTGSTVTVTPPAGVHNADGTPAGPVRLRAYTARMLPAGQ